MKNPTHLTNTKPLSLKEEVSSADRRNQTTRRRFLQFRTSDDGAFRAAISHDTVGHERVRGRFRGDLGSFAGDDAGISLNWGTFDDKGPR